MRKTKALLALLMTVVCLAGCSKFMSYTFDVSTGDKIKVKLNVSEGYELTQNDGQFYVEEDGERLVTGIFTTEEYWDYYTENIPVAEGCEVIKEDDLCGGNDGLVYTVEEETNAILHVGSSDTYVMLGSIEDSDDVLAVIASLTITAE